LQVPDRIGSTAGERDDMIFDVSGAGAGWAACPDTQKMAEQGTLGVADGDDRAVSGCSRSAAMIAIEAREPPISGLPVAMMTVPSSLTFGHMPCRQRDIA